MEPASLLQMALHFALAMSAGLIIGSERAFSKRMGLRDFVLIAMLGFVSSLLYPETIVPWAIAFTGVMGFSVATFVVVNLRIPSKSEHTLRPIGMTTMLTLPTTFLIASLPSFGVHFWVEATIIFVMLLTLKLKKHLRSFARALDGREIFDFAILIGIAISITPLIPKDAQLPVPLFDLMGTGVGTTYSHIDLASLWKVVVMVSLMSFVAHFITKYLRGRNALVLATFFGGLVSSLATIMMLLSRRKPTEVEPAEAAEAGFSSPGSLSRGEVFLGYVAANTGSIVKDIAVFRLVVGPEMFATFLLPLVSVLVLFAAISAYTFSSQKTLHAVHITKRPLPLRMIFKFSGILLALLILMQMVVHYMGGNAFVAASFLSGVVSSAASVTAIGSAMIQGDSLAGPWLVGLSLMAAFLGSISAKYLVIVRYMGLWRSLVFLAPIAALAGTMLLALWASLS